MAINILQIAVLPPPVGGVTIHVKRLTDRLSLDDDFVCNTFDYAKDKNIIKLLFQIQKADVVHIHLSNKRIRKKIVQFLHFIGKKSIVTFHGKYDFTNSFDKYVLEKSYISILLNNFTFENAKKLKANNIYHVGAFLPPTGKQNLSIEDVESIKKLKKKYHKVFCTNASNYVFDKDNKEIYMGSQLIEFFSKNTHFGFIFSDPSGNYKKMCTQNNIEVPTNIYFINKPHDFIPVIKMSDGFIRATTMDGDSLSVKESLYYDVPVFATDVVDRPVGTITFHSMEDLKHLLENHTHSTKTSSVRDNYQDIINIYKKSQYESSIDI